MLLLFTVTILLAREVMANFEPDDSDGEKNIEIIVRQALTPHLKILAEKLYENNYKNGEQETERRRKKLMEEMGLVQEKTSMDFEKRNDPVSSWTFWPEKEANIPIEERSRESNEEKKNQRFSPWGGKRIDSYLLNPEFRQTVHVFNNWSGKRGNEITKCVSREENGKLYAWNRLCSDNNMELKRVSKSNSERRVPFNSWGGKRASENVNFIPTFLKNLSQLEGENVLPENKVQYEKKQEKSMRKLDDRRLPSVQRFESWGGKRLASQEKPENFNLSGENFFEIMKSKIPKKRTNRDLRRKSTFQFWGGKRNPETRLENQKDTRRRQRAPYFVRKVFFPWGG